jgi:hypothetical protein
MTRLRVSLFLLVLAALAVSAVPAVAATAPAAAPVLDANLCPAPATPATGAPAPVFKVVPPADYILCSCSFCKANPDVDCQVSPSGYSILCSDWSRLHC